MNRVDAWRIIQRRAADLGTRVRIGCHTFRATGITAYLEPGGTLENAVVDASALLEVLLRTPAELCNSDSSQFGSHHHCLIERLDSR